MRAHGDRRKLVILARPPREHAAHLVDGHGAAERLAPALEPVAHLTVEIAQRQSANAALRRRAELRRLHQRVPKSLGVDLQVLHGWEFASPAGDVTAFLAGCGSYVKTC